MKLIKKVEIKYFRSIYNGVLKNVNDLNVVFGRNDSGKSNILRALNLFFNYQTNPELLFDFDRDFSYHRKGEADKNANVKKYVSVKITFVTPKKYPSLGKEFSVRRGWSIEGRPLDPREIITGVDKKYFSSVTRFLNSLSFHYIPAIKDRKIFESMLEEMYLVLSKDSKFSSSLATFSSELRSRTGTLTDSLKKNLNVDSEIAPPIDLVNLFKSLDFETGNKSSKLSLTLQRGDGIQVRHIPEILKFIADSKHSTERHIWGFEEPENSLELASAIEEAKMFKEISGDRNKQIFVTTHSPAFFNLEGENVERYYVNKTGGVHDKSTISLIKDTDEGPTTLMDEMPYLSSTSAALREEIVAKEKAQLELDALKKKVGSDQRSILWVEGESDRLILEKAIAVFAPYLADRIQIKFASGTEGLKGLLVNQRKDFLFNAFGERKIFVLVDNDFDGRSVVPGSGKFDSGVWNLTQSGAWSCLLKPTLEYESWLKEYRIQKNDISLVIEHCFSANLRNEARKVGKYNYLKYKNDRLYQHMSSKQHEAFETKYSELPSDHLDYFYLHQPAGDCKDIFSKWVTSSKNVTPENFSAFKPIVENLVFNL
jgi:curved DNA-binding protein CbpA